MVLARLRAGHVEPVFLHVLTTAIERLRPPLDLRRAAPSGVAIGTDAQAKTEGLTVEDVMRLLDAVQVAAASDVEEAHQTEVLEAVADLRVALSKEAPETGEVVKKAGRLRSLGARIGGASMMAATEGAASALMEMAMSGAFG